MTEIYNILRALGLSGKYAGFRFLATAVSLTANDEDYLLCATKTLYPIIAEQYGTTWSCVERNIRTAITICWARNRTYLEEIAGYSLSEKPGPVDFISIIANLFLRKKELV